MNKKEREELVKQIETINFLLKIIQDETAKAKLHSVREKLKALLNYELREASYKKTKEALYRMGQQELSD